MFAMPKSYAFPSSILSMLQECPLQCRCRKLNIPNPHFAVVLVLKLPLRPFQPFSDGAGFPPGFPPNPGACSCMRLERSYHVPLRGCAGDMPGFPPNGFPPTGFPPAGFPPPGFPPAMSAMPSMPSRPPGPMLSGSSGI